MQSKKQIRFLSLIFVFFWQEKRELFWFWLVQVRKKQKLDCRTKILAYITATGGPYSDPALPTTKLEIRPDLRSISYKAYTALMCL